MKHLLLAALLSLLPAEADWVALLKQDHSDFPNPERGFYSYQSLSAPSDEWKELRKKGISLIAGKLQLEAYREVEALPQTLLDEVRAGFTQARACGLKVIVRVNYGHRGPSGDYTTYEDPAGEILLAHMSQLAPVWEDNADVIALFEAGFVGPWGEWHTTRIAKHEPLQRKFFLEILKHTPRSRMVALRYPELKRSIFKRRKPLGEEEAYKATDLARTGHHNDCFLSSPNDVGTYGRGKDSRLEEVDYLAKETRYTVYGGETCALHGLNDAERTLAELDFLNASYLNSGYHPEVLAKWKDQGCYAEVSRRLGARFHVSEATVNGGRLTLTINNLGFASLFNARPVFLMRGTEDKVMEPVPIQIDPRSWKSGEKVTLTLDVETDEITQIGLWMPDMSLPLRNDPRYSIRFANIGAWDEVRGINWFVRSSQP
ncbi:DUF4832 domain-containing protein [Haloferula rosea]|uniref:DUF4832 domain-containing protein n=1 Tax=Haloferula rosea TaxID=490093 RepID=A0A934RFM0_9BACT|nr:DUF4832 domain-containing protein [Haloferula rosea]MBK1827646.1 DUF4832 domain-containing protein [Haloferula rosea]